MNLRAVAHVISFLVMLVSVAAALCAGLAWPLGDGAEVGLRMLEAAAMAGVPALGVFVLSRGRVELTRKDGFAIVTLGWLAAGVAGSLPFLWTGAIPRPVDALFETISGFTTTGSTILTDIEALPRAILFWRSLTQWLGGMGVLVLCVAILPYLGVGGMQIYRAEMPGPSKDRLTPRIANTAKLLYGVYFLLTVAQVVAMRLWGLGWYAALTHTFTTVSTGGFSPYNLGAAAFSPNQQWILIVFMLLAGISFALHSRFLLGKIGVYFRSEETRGYLLLIIGAALLLTPFLAGMDGRFRHALFQVVSVITTTGFASADFDLWPIFPQAVIFLLLFCGGCAGSTAGGIKIMRIQVIFKEVLRQIQLYLQPQAVVKIRLDEQSVAPNILAGITAFVICYGLLLVGFSLVMCLYLPDLVSATSAVVSCLGNVGPGLNAVGPMQNYSQIGAGGKLILSFCMLLGRLELFTVLVLFSPGFWKR